MVGGIVEDGPLIHPIESVSTSTLIGICVGAAFLVSAILMTWWLCRRRREHTKLGVDKSLAFRPPRRKPIAVKSPGSQGHYLKKSPSPTGPVKSPPSTTGTQAPSPTGSQPSANLPSRPLKSPKDASTQSPPLPSPTGTVSLSIENERDKAEVENNEKTDQGKGKYSLEEKKNSLGQLVFKLRYNAQQNALIVTVVQCKGLPERCQNANSDPYVKLVLLPEKQHRTKTRVLRNTRDPIYDEEFTFFGIVPSQLQTMCLYFIIMSFDRYSRDQVIGEVLCGLSNVPEIELRQDDAITLYKEIRPRNLKIHSHGRGELLVSLGWQPGINKLTVVVLKARNLPKMDVTGLADPYVKIYMLHNNQRICKRKTHVRKRTLNPVFNESIVFDVPSGAEGLSKISLEFSLLDWDRVMKNEVIGRLELGGPKCQGTALNHWNEVCNSPRRQIADWHKLRE